MAIAVEDTSSRSTIFLSLQRDELLLNRTELANGIALRKSLGNSDKGMRRRFGT